MANPPQYPDPHQPLFLDDPEPYPNAMTWGLWRAGYRLRFTPHGIMARRGQKIVWPIQFMGLLRRRLFDRADGLCTYCSIPVRLSSVYVNRSDYMTIDHRKPLSRGGTWKLSNLACCCVTCNRAKAHLDEEDFRAVLKRYPPEPGNRHVARIRSVTNRIASNLDCSAVQM